MCAFLGGREISKWKKKVGYKNTSSRAEREKERKKVEEMRRVHDSNLGFRKSRHGGDKEIIGS